VVDLLGFVLVIVAGDEVTGAAQFVDGGHHGGDQVYASA
jgi:hypothetical protein